MAELKLNAKEPTEISEVEYLNIYGDCLSTTCTLFSFVQLLLFKVGVSWKFFLDLNYAVIFKPIMS